VQWESNDRHDWAVMRHEGFQGRSSPVTWVRHFVMLKGFGTLLVDQLESEGEHDYTWLFHLLPCSPVLDRESKSVFTGFGEKNLLLQPATSPGLVGPILTDGTVNRQGRNLTAPVAKYETHAANSVQAYLLLPVSGASAPRTQLSQVADGQTVTLSITGDFGAQRVRITRSRRADQDHYALSCETLAANTTPDKPVLPR
jgi:hypothetical protein